MSDRVPSRQVLIEYLARCQDCEAHVGARNAQAWAHNHAQRTGHRVELSLGYIVKPATESAHVG